MANQVAEFVRFFEGKVPVQVSEVNAIFNDFTEMSLLDDIISRDDLVPLLEGLSVQVQGLVRDSLTKSIRMTGLVVEQALKSSKAQGANVVIDLSKTEDEALLSEVGRRAIDEPSSKEPEMRSSGFKLESIRDEHQHLLKEVERLKEENAALKERNQSIMRRATEALAEKNKASREVEGLRTSLAGAQGESAAAGDLADKLASANARLAKSSSQNSELQSQVDELTSRLQAAQERLAKLGDSAPVAPKSDFKTSKQFNQLKQLLAKKNAQLAELRRKLETYEPDNVTDADAEGKE